MDNALIRLTNDAFAMTLHLSLYKRMMDFCAQHTPYFPAEPIVTAWLQRLYSGDTTLHILIRLDDDFNIVDHAVIDVQEGHGFRAVHCYQVQADKPGLDKINEGIEYIDKLCAEVNAVCSVMFVQKNAKAIEKRYGYRPMGTMMIKQGES
jgi:hypothetical protein